MPLTGPAGGARDLARCTNGAPHRLSFCIARPGGYPDRLLAGGYPSRGGRVRSPASPGRVCLMESELRSADWWDARYLSGDIPWDTGIVPPEVVALATSGLLKFNQKPAWALDLGCGSGVSSHFLAHHGFHVIGIDLAQSALARGCRAAVAQGLPAFFCRGDVSDLAFLRVSAIPGAGHRLFPRHTARPPPCLYQIARQPSRPRRLLSALCFRTGA